MPVLQPGAPELAGIDVTRLFSSELPGGGRSGVGMANLARQSFGVDAMRNFGQLATLSSGLVAVSFGLPSVRLPALTNMLQQWPLVASSVALARAAVAGQVVGALAEWGTSLAGVTSVPVVGWVVAILAHAYRSIDSFAKLIGSIASSAPAVAYVYDKESDEYHARRIMALVTSPDWTRAFLPLNDAETVSSVRIAWSGGDPQGRRFQPVQANATWDEPRGFGVVPGLPLLETVYQYRYNRPPADMVTGASLFPSAMQAGGMLWSLLQQPGPCMFTIRAGVIRAAWRNWYSQLAKAGAPSAEAVRMRTYATRWWDADTAKLGGHRFAGYSPSKVPALYAADRSIGSLVSYILHRWRQRAVATLETIVCAYVPDDAPALEDDPLLKLHHANMRKALLQHPARHEVELDMVPDAAYRSALVQARLQASTDFAAAGGAWSLDGLPGVTPDAPDVPPGVPLPGASSGSGGGGAVLGVLGGLGLLGVGYLVARR